jgi:hypothetical protein
LPHKDGSLTRGERPIITRYKEAERTARRGAVAVVSIMGGSLKEFYALRHQGSGRDLCTTQLGMIFRVHTLILMKCLLLQQWFRIDSDPELETQINDRTSFKTFLGLSLDQPSPDHSTFSRFRSRFSKDTMRMINHELLSQFASRGLTINEGIAVDARLVKSASHPLIPSRKCMPVKGILEKTTEIFSI